MPITHRKPKEKKELPYEQRPNIVPLYVHITIVPSGQAQAINKLYNSLGVSCQFIQRGRGTANRAVREILGIEDNHKDIIISLMPENLIERLSKELEAYFLSSEKNRGIGFTIKMDSIISARVYNFIANAL